MSLSLRYRWLGCSSLALFSSLSTASSARAGQTLFGYELGLTHSTGAVITNEGQAGAGASATGESFQRLTGLQLNTAVSMNGTADVLFPTVAHSFLLGASYNQLVPALVPKDASGTQRQPQGGVNASASYLAAVTREQSRLTFGSSYTFGLNAQVPIDSNGGVASTSNDGSISTLPGRTFGPFILNQDTHTARANVGYRWDAARWDFDSALTYAFIQGGLISVLPQAAQDAGAGGTGALLPTTSHSVSPSAGYRRRVAKDDVISATASGRITIPIRTAAVRTATVPPRTAETTLTLAYQRLFGAERTVGAELSGTFAWRVPSDGRGFLLTGPSGLVQSFEGDTLLVALYVTYADFVRSLELKINARAGAAQARLFQPPLGQARNDFISYATPVVAPVEPVFSIDLERRFRPVDLRATVARSMGVGGLGASAVMSEHASLVGSVEVGIGPVGRRPVFSLGTNAVRVRGVGRDRLPTPPGGPASGGIGAVLVDTVGLGVLANLLVPLTKSGGFNLDSTLSYNLLFAAPLDSAPGTVATGAASSASHTVLWLLRATWGQNTATDSAQAPHDVIAYAGDSDFGGPLLSTKLMKAWREPSRIQRMRSNAPGLPSTHEKRRDVEAEDSRAPIPSQPDADTREPAEPPIRGEGPIDATPPIELAPPPS